jgi:hypothetical protein
MSFYDCQTPVKNPKQNNAKFNAFDIVFSTIYVNQNLEPFKNDIE